MDTDNDRGVSLEGPLHTSLRSHFLKYYTLQKKSEDYQNAERRLQILDRITDRQEES